MITPLRLVARDVIGEDAVRLTLRDYLIAWFAVRTTQESDVARRKTDQLVISVRTYVPKPGD